MARTFFNKFNPDCRCCQATQLFGISAFCQIVKTNCTNIYTNSVSQFIPLLNYPYFWNNSPLSAEDPERHLLSYYADTDLTRVSPGLISRYGANLYCGAWSYSPSSPFYDSSLDSPFTPENPPGVVMYADSDFTVRYNFLSQPFPNLGYFNYYAVFEAGYVPIRVAHLSPNFFYNYGGIGSSVAERFVTPADYVKVLIHPDRPSVAAASVVPDNLEVQNDWGLVDSTRRVEYVEKVWTDCDSLTIKPPYTAPTWDPHRFCPKAHFGHTRCLTLLVDDEPKYFTREFLDWYLRSAPRRLFIFGNNKNNHANNLLESLNVPIRYSFSRAEHVRENNESAHLDYADLVPDNPASYLYLESKTRLLTRGSWHLNNGEPVAEYGGGTSMAYYKRGPSEVYVSGCIDNMMPFLPFSLANSNGNPSYVTNAALGIDYPGFQILPVLPLPIIDLASVFDSFPYNTWPGPVGISTPLVSKGSFGIKISSEWPQHEKYLSMQHFTDRFRTIPVP